MGDHANHLNDVILLRDTRHAFYQKKKMEYLILSLYFCFCLIKKISEINIFSVIFLLLYDFYMQWGIFSNCDLTLCDRNFSHVVPEFFFFAL